MASICLRRSRCNIAQVHAECQRSQGVVPKIRPVPVETLPTPPPKNEIYQAIMEVSDENRLGIDLGFDHRGIGKVSQYWLLVCLMELAPNHRFFQKDYLPESKRNVKDTREISAADYGFFMNLPE